MSEKQKDEIAEVKVQVPKFAVNFLQTYLDFIGSSLSVQDVFRDLFFDGIVNLRNELGDLPHQESSDLFRKYPQLYILTTKEEEKELEAEQP